MGENGKCKQEGNCLCPVKGIINVVSKKWTVCLVSLLHVDTPMRFTEIKSEIGEISPKALSDILKILEREDLIRRESFAEIPPRVEYYLTDDGRELKELLVPLVDWARARNGQ